MSRLQSAAGARARCSSAPSARFELTARFASTVAADVSGTKSGSPIDECHRGEGLGDLRAVPARGLPERDRPRGERGAMGCPVAPASQTAPGCATRAGPRGPSTVKATGRPAVEIASQLHQRARRAARRRSARGAEPEPREERGNPLAVEVAAGDDDDAAIAEVVQPGEDPPVPERENRLTSRLQRSSSKWLPPSTRQRQRAAERRDERITRPRQWRVPSAGRSPAALILQV